MLIGSMLWCLWAAPCLWCLPERPPARAICRGLVLGVTGWVWWTVLV